MKQTSLGIEPRAGAVPAARYAKDGTRLPEYAASPTAAADVWSSVVDLVRFGQLHCAAARNSAEILPARIIEQMRSTLQPMGRYHYGLGWVVERDAAQRVRVRHGGAGAGVGAELTIVPQEKLVVAVLVNADTSKPSEPRFLPTQLADAILEVCLTGTARPVEEVRVDDAVVADRAVPERFVGLWRGRIETPASGDILTCAIKPTGEVTARLNTAETVALKGVRFGERSLSGRFDGRLQAPNANRRPYELELNVELSDEQLQGAITTISVHPSRGEALPYWVTLHREGDGAN